MSTDVNIGATFFFIVNKPVTLNLQISLFVCFFSFSLTIGINCQHTNVIQQYRNEFKNRITP